MSYNKSEILNLPLPERKALANELIDSILAEESKPVPEWKKELIKERVQYHYEHQGNGTTWDELKKQYGR